MYKMSSPTVKMPVFFLCIILLNLSCALSYETKIKPPVFGTEYVANGVLRLPYAEINEPFTAYYDGNHNRSRIDYYGGLVKTYQRADITQFGRSFKIAPMTTEKVLNQINCFQVNGTSAADAITPQSVLPDMTGFQFIGIKIQNNLPCNVWEHIVVTENKKSTYTMYVTVAGQLPVRYEMMGYDSLLGSHYDKYYVDFISFIREMPPDAIFQIADNQTCHGFPGPGAAESVILMNPMREYIHRDDVHIHAMFNDFKVKHDREYVTTMEHETRKHTFRQNVRFIHSKNRQGLTFSLAVNHLADHSPAELRMMRGYHKTPGQHGGKPFPMADFNIKDLPDSVDWRLNGAVTPVKDQAVCGSCWSFGTAETIEGAHFLKTGNLVRLSQQELMDCSWGEGNNACDGGEDFRSYEWIIKHGGLTSEEQYGPYLAQDGNCHSANVTAVAVITGYVNVTPYDETALKTAIANKGPISVGIDAAHTSLSFYSNGVYYEPKCGSKPDDLDHAVLAVGYGTLDGKAYWLIKNSWSTYWGNDGYVLMSMQDNNCGVETSPTYVTM